MEYNKGHLESFYEDIKETRKLREEHIERVQKLDNEIQVKLLEYRINSTLRILDYLHDKSFIESEHIDYSKYINHCCNKLCGNIDGIELDLEEENNV